MRLLVTGATGFVGRYAVAELAKRHDVTGVVRDRASAADLGPVEVVVADLEDPTFPVDLPAGVDVVLHLAQAYLPFPEYAATIFEVNAASTQRLAEWARCAGVTRIVFASSGSVYRPSREPLREDSPTVPPSFHPATKLAAETLLSYYRGYFGIATLRLFGPYGPGQVNRLIPRLIGSVEGGAPVVLSRGGEPRINPIHVTDLVNVIAQAVEGSGSYTVNVAGPRAVSIRDLAEIIATTLGRTPTFEARDGEVEGDFVADTTRMRELFDAPEQIDPADGVADMVARLKAAAPAPVPAI